MKILYLCNSIARQGTFFRWHNLARGLIQLGHELTMFAFDHATFGAPERTEQIDGVSYRICCGNRGQSLLSQENHPITALRGSLRAHDHVDIVHAFQPCLTSALPWLFRRHALAGTVIYDWDDLWKDGLIGRKAGTIASRWTKWATSRLERALPSRADHVTTCSAYLAELARKRGAKGTTVIGNGFWPASYSSKAESRRQLGLRSDCIYAGFMGRTITETELAWLAAAERVASGSEVPCRIAVCGMPEALLNAQFSESRQGIQYLGILTPEQSRMFASALDVGLLPLENAPVNRARFPIKFAEYLSAGVPILMSKVGPCADISANWPWVVQAEPNERSWEKAFCDTIAKIGMGERLLVDGRSFTAEHSWLRLAEQLEDTYGEVLATRA